MDCGACVEPPFDIESAIQALSRGRDVTEARNLARTFHRFDVYVKMLADEGQWEKLCDFLPLLPVRSAESEIITYGDAL
jgi:hypothetical protein